MVKQLVIVLFIITSFLQSTRGQNHTIVFQTDFGLKDGAVAAMKGVAMGVDSSLKLFDLTHEIPAYNVWEAAYRLQQTVPHWPAGTVFVSVVDPGVGTNRRSVVLKTKKGHYIVGPDNGTLTLIALLEGIEAVREIDEAINRREGSANSYTFHGRDVYAYTAARLASRKISYEETGNRLPDTVVTIPFQQAVIDEGSIKGTIPILDIQYGNIWTNIPAVMIEQLGIKKGDHLQVTIYHKFVKKYQGMMRYSDTFGDVEKGKPLAYLNSLLELSFAINQGDFATVHKIKSGSDWTVAVKLYRN